LHQYKMNNYYKSINLIHHLLTKQPLPDIRKYRKALVERHPKIKQFHNELKVHEQRTNFLNVGYVLRASLIMEGHIGNAEDFVSLSTRDALVSSDRLMIKICQRIKATMTEDELKYQSWDFHGLA
jgi:hypothetical protein